MGLAETAELAVRIGLDDHLSPGLRKISGNLSRFESSTKRIGGGIGKLAGGIARVGLVAGGVAAVGLAAAAKSAIEFDDAFAGVAKTVEGVDPAGLQKINDQLHALATRIPVKYTDLADIAAEAGALGVAAPQIAHFTEVVARLSASTQGLSVEAAAEAFGKFRNTLHLADKDMDKAASALLALGNAGASSEADIIEVGKRFAAAGHLAGLSAADVLGFASAITSLGVQPEAAGSSLSRLFNNITKYIGTGDKKIKAFADTAHLSVKQFSQLFAHDAKGAVLDFLKGLSGLDKFKATAALKAAGITNVRDINAVLLLSQNYKELNRQLGVSEDAFSKGTALAEVSAKRFDTLKNKITVLKNNLLEAGYNLAEGFLPALGRATDKLTAFLQVPANKTALQNLGKELGDLLDKIDWNQLEKGAEGAVAAIKPMLDILVTIAQTLNGLPAEVKGAAAGLLIANKVSGGAIGAGIGQIVGGLGESLAKNLISHVPLFGSAFVQPVFVTNPGFGLPGGPAGEGAGAAAAKAAAGGTAGAAIVITDMHAFNNDLANSLSKSDSAFAQQVAASARKQANSDTPWDQILDALGIKPDPYKSGTLSGPVGAASPQNPIGEHALAGLNAIERQDQKTTSATIEARDAIRHMDHGNSAILARLQNRLVNITRQENRALRNGNKAGFHRLLDEEHVLVRKAAKQGSLTQWLGSLNRREAIATRTHNARWLGKLQAKEEQVRAAIQRKQLSVTVVNNISIAKMMSAQNKVKTYTANGSYVYANNGHGK